MKKLILLILGILTLSSQICLAESPVFTTFPSYTKDQNKWIVRDANPGTQSEDYITLSNLSNEAIHLTLSIKELDGTKEKPVVVEDENYKNIGQWTSLEKSQITLNAKEKTQVKININVPANAKLGKYQEVILVNHTTTQANNLDVSTRLGNRIYLNVTNQQDLQANTQNLSISPLQITLIILASLGIVASLLLPSKQK